MQRIVVEAQDLPGRSRPAFVGYMPGGRMDFPIDAIAEAYNTRNSRNALAKAGVVLHVKRIPKGELSS
jgi:hypothetical protein